MAMLASFHPLGFPRKVSEETMGKVLQTHSLLVLAPRFPWCDKCKVGLRGCLLFPATLRWWFGLAEGR